MKLFRTRAGALLVLLAIPLLASAPASAARPATTAEAIDAMLAKAIPADGPGAVVIAVKDGKTVFRKAYGMANLELGVPLAPDSVLRLGSITKQFTATAVLMLAEEGKLALSDPITKFLPGYPTHGHVITVEHLLNHTSGIRSYTGIPGYMGTKIQADLTPAQLIDAFKSEPMDFAPGERWQYNNSGYVLLGAVIEKASGTTYAEFVGERIFKPLGMKATAYGAEGPVLPKRAAGYTREGETVFNARYLSMSQPYSAGALVSTVDDLAAWDAALYTEKLVKKASLEKAWTPAVTRDGKPTHYGYGWGISTLRGARAIAHGGGIFGFSTYGIRLPDEKVYVAVLANSDSPKTDPGMLGKRIAALLIGRPFPAQVPVPVDPKVLARWTGVYRFDPQTTRTVTVEGGKLFSQRSGGPRLEVKPSSETEFFYEGSLTRLEFVAGPDGRAKEVLFFPDGAEEPERGVREGDVPSAPAEVKVDPALYDLYAGEYELNPGFVLTVRRDGARLLTQATGQQEFELFPASETEYFLKVVDARITFVKGADGKVNELVLRQGGREMPAKRRR
ncbi:MAG: serine hydrolase [Holophagales bacterium]|nr:serine hydrolase [Holophagales bacterium]